jgi:predicted dehydrogenase
VNAVRFGVVGCGAICGVHADGIKGSDGAELVGFFDVVPERSAEASNRHGGHAFASLEELLGRVDAVCVCVPSGTHAEVALAAADQGVHVLCEKPIEVTLAKALRMVEACEGRVKMGVISQHRFAPDIQRLRERILQGDLGKPIACDIRIKWYRTQAYYDSGDWRGTWEQDGGGCLMNQGVHYIDMGQWIMGGIRSVQAQTRTLAHERIEVEDIANALLEFENGAVGVLQGSTSYYPGFVEKIEVHGTWGTAVIEGDLLKVDEVDAEAAGQGLYGKGVMSQPAPNIAVHGVGGVESSVAVPWGEQHRLQIQDFTEAIRTDRDPFITGRDALQPLAAILAVYESARRGGAKVTLEEVAASAAQKTAGT